MGKMKKISCEDILKDWLSSSDSEDEELQTSGSYSKSTENNNFIKKKLMSDKEYSKKTTDFRSSAEEISGCRNSVEGTSDCTINAKEISGCKSDAEEISGCRNNAEKTSGCRNDTEEISGYGNDVEEISVCGSNAVETSDYRTDSEEISGCRSDAKEISSCGADADESPGCISYAKKTLGLRSNDENISGCSSYAEKTSGCSNSHNALISTSNFSFSSNDCQKLTSKTVKVFEIANKGGKNISNNSNIILQKRKTCSKEVNKVNVKSHYDLRSSKTYKISSCYNNVPVLQEVKQKLRDDNVIIYPIHRKEWESRNFFEVAVIIDRHQTCSTENTFDGSNLVLNSNHENIETANGSTESINENETVKLNEKHLEKKIRMPTLCEKSPDEGKESRKYNTSEQCPIGNLKLSVNEVSSSIDLPVINSTKRGETIETNFSNIELKNITNADTTDTPREHRLIRKRRRKCDNFFVHKSKLYAEIKPHIKSSVDPATQITQDSHCQFVSKLCFECKLCSEKFATELLLNRHVKLHQASKYFECNYCAHKTQNRQSFIGHINMHERRPCRQCDICGETFMYRQKYYYHLWSHRNDLPFTCDVCKKKFMRYSSLYQHMSLHTGNIVKYNCRLCSKIFASSTGLNNHVRSFHCKETRCCPYCFNRYSVGNLGTHIKHWCSKKSH